jgi:hypothetical protein
VPTGEIRVKPFFGTGEFSFLQTPGDYFQFKPTAEFMKNRSWRSIFIFCMASLLLAVSCSPPQPASREDILKWNTTTLKGSYDSAGRKNPKWDSDAEAALTQFARTRTASADELEVLWDLVGEAAASAVAAGCNDPMINYLYVRYAPASKNKAFSVRQELFRSAASNLGASAYPPIRKFYANVDAAEILWLRRNTNLWPVVRDFRYRAVTDLNQALQDRTLPEAEAYQAADVLFQMLSRNTHELTNAYNTIEATLLGNRAKPAVAPLIKAEFYLMYAWRGRGNGTADQVTEEGWRLFRVRLAEAEKALNKAQALDPGDAQIPTLMISIAQGQQKPRAEMEKWFQRAMKLDPNNYQACRNKLHWLLPQWYGSRDDMLAFGRACVASTNWGGQVPLTLVDAHSEFVRTLEADARSAYWLAPDVWPDIKRAYEKYAQINPALTRFRYPYAAYAFRCEQWQDFNEQIKIIRQNDVSPNYNYFGGKDVFDKMAEQATSRGKATSGH